MNIKIDILKEKIDKSKKIAIFAHEFADWDAIGSSLGLWTILEKLWKKVKYFTPLDISQKYNFIEKTKIFETKFDFYDYDIMIFCDISSTKRIDMFWNQEYIKDKNTVNIDHHIDNSNFANLNIVKHKNHSSTCEIIFEIIEKLWKDKIDSEIATYLYLGLTTDTWNFMYERDSIKAFDIWKKLIKHWANKKKIINWIYYSATFQDFVFRSKLLQKIKKEKNLIYVFFTEDELEKDWIDRWSIKTSILESLKTIKWVDIFLSLDQTWDYLKWSLRSHKPVVNKIAHIFWWWWHPKASWFKIKLEKNLNKQVENVIRKINQEYDRIK